MEIMGKGHGPGASPYFEVLEDGIETRKEAEEAVLFYRNTGDYIAVKIAGDDEVFVPREIEDLATSYGIDTADPALREVLSGIVAEDPDLFGDWDRYQ